MTVHAQTITNPGAELGTTGWTVITPGSGTLVTGTPAHSGSAAFRIDGNFIGERWISQYIDVSALSTAIDTGLSAMEGGVWFHGGTGGDTGAICYRFYEADSVTLIDEVESATLNNPTYEQAVVYSYIPENTRFIEIVMKDHFGGTVHQQRWDDHTLNISDAPATDWPAAFAPLAHQLGTYALGIYPAEQGRLNQGAGVVVAAAETSNGLYEAKAEQLGVYVLVRGKTDRRDLRAWTFTQDDHDFYVLQLGDDRTLVFDKLTGQWAQWRSPSFTYWRGNDGVQWEGWNICCDTESGKLWIIDPEGRLDEDTTPITSVVSGRVQTRMRKNAQCHMAELAVSEQEPPTGIDASTLTITLRTSDDDGQNYVSHGSVTGEDIGDDITVRWYGLGLMPAPGRVFEITDTGYARRIDGFNIEVGGAEVG